MENAGSLNFRKHVSMQIPMQISEAQSLYDMHRNRCLEKSSHMITSELSDLCDLSVKVDVAWVSFMVGVYHHRSNSG